MQKSSSLVLVIFITGCATQHISERCQSYSISGGSYPWAPTKFYQSESNQNQLYIEIPKTVSYIPKLEVVDTEFDQPYKIDYTFDNKTYRFKVEDNHEEYLLYRHSYDGFQREEIYITCNRYD